MAQDTKTYEIGKANELLADIRNSGAPYFEKDVFIFAHRYTVTTDYTAGYGLTINVNGAQEILFASVKEGKPKIFKKDALQSKILPSGVDM